MKKKTTYIIFAHRDINKHPTNTSQWCLVQSLMPQRQAGVAHGNPSRMGWLTALLPEAEITSANSTGPANTSQFPPAREGLQNEFCIPQPGEEESPFTNQSTEQL